jgi:hypothetical protein
MLRTAIKLLGKQGKRQKLTVTDGQGTDDQPNGQEDDAEAN